jgi:hypothetical protein
VGQADMNITVFDDVLCYGDDDPFYRASAQILTELMASLLRTITNREIVVANAGGPTIWNTVRSLDREVIRSAEIQRLLFLSLSSAGLPDRFHYTCNFLSVRLAELFNGKHFAPVTSEDLGPGYTEKIKAIDLFVAGVGARDGYLEDWVKKDQQTLPQEIVGDLLYIPYDSEGCTVQYPPGVQKAINELHLRPTYDEFQNLLRNGARVLAIVTDTAQPFPKANMVKVILKARLATDMVLTASLASHLLKNATI